MTLVTFPYNGTPGTAATTQNTGAYSIATGSGSSQVFAVSAAFQGSTGLRCISNGTASSALRHLFKDGATATKASYSIRVKIPSVLPSATSTLFQINDTTPARVLQLQYTPSGLLKINDKSNVSQTLLTAAQATPGTSFRVSIVVTTLSTTAGVYTAKAYSTGSTAIGSLSITNANTGTVAMGGAYVGVVTPVAITHDVDSLQMNDGSTAEIGEYVPNTTKPTITSITGSQTVTPNSVVPLAATATAYNGDTIASYNWIIESALDNFGDPIAGLAIDAPDQPSTSIRTPAATFGRIVVGLTVTDSSGNVSTESLTKVFIPTNVGAPIAVTTSAGWNGGSAAAVSDGSDSTAAISGGPGSGAVLTLRLPPMTPPTAGANFLNVRSLVTATGGTQQVELLEGNTVRKNWGAISPGTSYGDHPFSLSGGEISAVGSWNELDLRLTQV
jgi:hypothetical protein